MDTVDRCYLPVLFDAIRVGIRDEGFARNEAVYLALSMLPDGAKRILEQAWLTTEIASPLDSNPWFAFGDHHQATTREQMSGYSSS